MVEDIFSADFGCLRERRNACLIGMDIFAVLSHHSLRLPFSPLHLSQEPQKSAVGSPGAKRETRHYGETANRLSEAVDVPKPVTSGTTSSCRVFSHNVRFCHRCLTTSGLRCSPVNVFGFKDSTTIYLGSSFVPCNLMAEHTL
jgi:hypothetical protein